MMDAVVACINVLNPMENQCCGVSNKIRNSKMRPYYTV